MLQRLIHSARANVFESTRFYYGLLWVLIGYSIVREVIQKFALVYHTEPYILPREIVGVLFFVFAFCSTISAWFLRKKIDKNILIFVSIISIISLINELRFALEIKEYSLRDSLTTGQLYYVAKIIFPLLFLGFWSILDFDKSKTTAFIDLIEKLFIANAALIIFGGIFSNFSILESYPLSGRWGYCGLLLHRVPTQLIYGLLLLRNWNSTNPFYWKSLLLIICLLISGQKAGFLWLILFLFIVVFKKPIYRVGLFIAGLSILISIPVIMNKVIALSTFWNSVYQEHGAWGVLFSTRNTTLFEVWKILTNDKSWIDLVFGGISRYPLYIEMLPFDLFVYFGALGLIVSTWLFIQLVPSWKWGIPLLIAVVAGGIIGYPLMTLVYFMMIFLIKHN